MSDRLMEMRTLALVILPFLSIVPFSVSVAYGFGPNDPECFELGNCDFFAAPLDAMVEPFTAILGDFTLVLVWGIIMAILWLRVSNTMMTGLVGLALAAVFQQGFSEEAQVIGYSLLGLAIAIAIFQIITVRISFPQN